MPRWNRYTCRIRVTRLVGGIPVVPEGADRADAYERWARGQGVEQDPSFERPLHDVLAADPDMPVAVEVDDIAGLETGFRRDEHGIYIEARQVKAMLREAAQRLGYLRQVRGLRQVVQHDLYVRALDGSLKIRLYPTGPDGLPDGRDPAEPDGREQRPISVVTRQGPRTAIKRFEYVEDRDLEFEVRVLAGGVGDGLLDGEKLREMLEQGGWLGLGADRSQDCGTFDVKLFEEIEEIEESDAGEAAA